MVNDNFIGYNQTMYPPPYQPWPYQPVAPCNHCPTCGKPGWNVPMYWWQIQPTWQIQSTLPPVIWSETTTPTVGDTTVFNGADYAHD